MCPAVFKLTGVQTLCNCCGIYEVTSTKVADNVFVQVLDLQLDLLLERDKQKGVLNIFKVWFKRVFIPQTQFHEHMSFQY